MDARRRLATACGVGLASLALAACGGGEPGTARTTASAGDYGCRQKWAQLGRDIAADADRSQPSALPERWNSVSATVDYYRTAARAKDCGATLDGQRRAIASLKEFSSKLAPFDMERRLAAVREDASAYAAGPRPPAPTPSAAPSGKGRKRTAPKRLPRPPAPAVVAAALRTLTAQAPVATREQEAGWEQAGVTDLADAAAVAKAVNDLRFLSTQSRAWRACAASLALIEKALAARR